MSNSNVFQEFVFKRTYARYLPEEKRKENWGECVKRYIDYLFKDTNPLFQRQFKDRCFKAILNQQVMPSMRMLMTAGIAHSNDNISGYNCCYVAVDCQEVFSEILYILMNGCGVGYSVEKEKVNLLPDVPENLEDFEPENPYSIGDSKLHWAEAFKFLIKELYEGRIHTFDYRKIRAKGEPLKTFGGFASGHEPLKELFDFTIETFKNSKGRKLITIECHSIVCKTASIVVVGGVRRSALICLSDLDDKDLAEAKSGQWYVNNLHYSLANNSAVYKKKPSLPEFMKEYKTIYESYSGERGFYSLEAVNKKVDKVERRRAINKDYFEFGSNPCCEIILKSAEFCNLSEVIVRPEDTEATLISKIGIATVLGTLQSRYTDFKFLRPIYKQNCEEERLLGVSMTGIFDNILTRKPTKEFLEELKNTAIFINKTISEELGINQSASITAIKPSGTCSALNGTSSGLHPNYAKYYIRNVRISSNDPLCDKLIKANVPYEVDFYSKANLVFSFYLKSPEGAITTKELDPLEHFRLWRMYNDYYCEHKPSITINYNDSNFLQLGAEIYKHFDTMTGIALLPKDDNTYQQSPFIEITEEQFLEGLNKQPTKINWDNEKYNAKFDNENKQQCLGNNCDTL